MIICDHNKEKRHNINITMKQNQKTKGVLLKMAEIKKMGYCVNGEWKESKAEKYMDVTDSSTGEVIAQVPCCTPDEVEEAIASAQAAYPEWSALSLAKRQQYMFKWRDILYAH